MKNSCFIFFIFKEREKVRQHLREKYNLEKPISNEKQLFNFFFIFFIFKEREKVRQHLREKYNLEKPESVEEPEEETESSSSGFKKLKGFKKNHFHHNVFKNLRHLFKPVFRHFKPAPEFKGDARFSM